MPATDTQAATQERITYSRLSVERRLRIAEMLRVKFRESIAEMAAERAAAQETRDP